MTSQPLDPGDDLRHCLPAVPSDPNHQQTYPTLDLRIKVKRYFFPEQVISELRGVTDSSKPELDLPTPEG